MHPPAPITLEHPQVRLEPLGMQHVNGLNLASQRAIERLGTRKDGVLRNHAARRDGSVRDTVMYSLTRDEWPEVDARLRQAMHGA